VKKVEEKKVAEKKEVKKVEEKKVEQKVEVSEEVEKVTVKRVKVEGVEYLWSQQTNVLYNMSKEEVGIYDPVTKTINELPEDGEIEEEEYESEEE
jgi:hypothetical protein